MVEIYCESIKDLLSDDPCSGSLTVQQDREHGIIIAGALRVCFNTEQNSAISTWEVTTCVRPAQIGSLL